LIQFSQTTSNRFKPNKHNKPLIWISIGSCLAIIFLTQPVFAQQVLDFYSELNVESRISGGRRHLPAGGWRCQPNGSATFQPASKSYDADSFLIAKQNESNALPANGSAGFQPASKGSTTAVIIDRAKREMKVIQNGKIIQSCKIGIGRGGLNRKKSMADNVTPTGRFEVDIILTSDSNLNKTSDQLLRKYKGNTKAVSYLSSGDGLKRLFANMNGLDFDGNGKPDTAYGAAYIGLNGISKSGQAPAITGPKLSTYAGKDYWFSIALHGTPDEEKNLGNANSGGCVHLPKSALQTLISNETIKIGSIVEIK